MTDFNPSADDTGPFEFELAPEGPTAVRCARIIEVGEQSSQYGVQNRAVIALSLPYTFEYKGETKQKMLSNPYGITISNNERSSMRQYTNALNPDAKNLGDFLNCVAQITVVHRKNKTNDRVSERIDNISPLLPGTPVPELDTEPFWFKWDDPDTLVWSMIPEFTKNLIENAVNYPGSKVEEMVLQAEPFKIEGDDDDLPF